MRELAYDKWVKTDKLLLHLYKSSRRLSQNPSFYPISLTQEGIKEHVGVDPRHVAQFVRSINQRAKELGMRDFVQVIKGRVAGKKRERNVYVLTQNGLEYAKDLLKAPEISEIEYAEVQNAIAAIYKLRGFQRVETGDIHLMTFRQTIMEDMHVMATAHAIYEPRISGQTLAEIQQVFKDQHLQNLTVIYDRKVEGIDLEPYSKEGMTFTSINDLFLKVTGVERYLRNKIEAERKKQRVGVGPDENILTFYQPINCITPRKMEEDAYEYLMKDWLPSERSTALVVGYLGTGKTWLTKKITYDLAKSFIKDPHNGRIPIYISVKEQTEEGKIKMPADLLDILLNFFATNVIGAEIPFPKQMIKRLLEAGKLLVILDGFDEMAQQMNDEFRILEDFRHLLDIASIENSKTIITSRILYITAIPYELTKYVSELYEREQIETSKKPVVVKLVGFPRESADKYIDTVLGKVHEVGEKWLGSSYNLIKKWLSHEDILRIIEKQRMIRMVKNPFLFQLFMRWGLVKGPADLFSVISNSVAEWWKRDEWRYTVNLPKVSKEKLDIFRSSVMQELALEIMKNKGLRKIPLELLNSFIEKYVYRHELPFSGPDLNAFQVSARMSTFLMSDLEGRFSFLHDNFLHFFIAEKLSLDIKDCNFEYFTENNLTFFPPLEEEIYIPSLAQRFLRNFLTEHEQENNKGNGETIEAFLKSALQRAMDLGRRLYEPAPTQAANLYQFCAQLLITFPTDDPEIRQLVEQVLHDTGLPHQVRWRYLWAIARLDKKENWFASALRYSSDDYRKLFINSPSRETLEGFKTWVTYIIGQSIEEYRFGREEERKLEDWVLADGETVRSLIDLLRGTSPKESNLIKAICWTLGQIGDKQAEEDLRKTLEDKEAVQVHGVVEEALEKIFATFIHKEIVDNEPKLLEKYRCTFYTPRIDEVEIHKYFFRYKSVDDIDVYRRFIRRNITTENPHLAWFLGELAGTFDDIIGVFEKKDIVLEQQLRDFQKRTHLCANWNLFWAFSKVKATPKYADALGFGRLEYKDNIPKRPEVLAQKEVEELKPWVAFGLGQMVFLYRFEDEEIFAWALGAYWPQTVETRLLDQVRKPKSSQKLRRAAAWALGLFGSKTARSGLLEILDNLEKHNMLALQISESIRRINSYLILWDILHLSYDRVSQKKYMMFNPCDAEVGLDPRIFTEYARMIEGSEMKPAVRSNIEEYIESGIKRLGKENIVWFTIELSVMFSEYIEREGRLIREIGRLRKSPSVNIETRWNCYCALSKIANNLDFQKAIFWKSKDYLSEFELSESGEDEETFDDFLYWYLSRVSEMIRDPTCHYWLFGHSSRSRKKSFDQFIKLMSYESEKIQRKATDIVGRIPYQVSSDEKMIDKCISALKDKLRETSPDTKTEILKALTRIKVSKLKISERRFPKEKHVCRDRLYEIDESLGECIDEIKEPIYSALNEIKDFTYVDLSDYVH